MSAGEDGIEVLKLGLDGARPIGTIVRSGRCAVNMGNAVRIECGVKSAVYVVEKVLCAAIKNYVEITRLQL